MNNAERGALMRKQAGARSADPQKGRSAGNRSPDGPHRFRYLEYLEYVRYLALIHVRVYLDYFHC